MIHAFGGSFAGGDGENPYGAPILDAAGNVYGTTMAGGLGSGIVYRLAPQADGS